MLVRRTLDKIWNVYWFFITYANIDGFDPTQHQLPVVERSELDRWIISELQETIREVTAGLNKYDTVKPTAAIQDIPGGPVELVPAAQPRTHLEV